MSNVLPFQPGAATLVDGDPTGVFAPAIVGHIAVDPSTGDTYVGIGTTSADWKPTGGGGGSQPVQLASVVLTSAQLLALTETPVQLIAAPGVGKAIICVTVVLNYRAGATPYTVNGTNLFINADGTASNDFGWMAWAQAGFIDQADSQVASTTFLDGNGQVAESGLDNAPIFAACDSDPTDGDGTLGITILYFVADVA